MKIIYICNRISRGQSIKPHLEKLGHDVVLWSANNEPNIKKRYMQGIKLPFQDADVLLTETVFHGSTTALIKRLYSKLKIVTYAKGDGFLSIRNTRGAFFRLGARRTRVSRPCGTIFRNGRPSLR